MSFQAKITAAFQAVGADIKALQAGTTTATVTEYRSSYDGGWIYAGYLLNGNPVITRRQDNTTETADGVTDLETAWADRTNLNY